MENKHSKKKLTLSISGSVKKPPNSLQYVKGQNRSSVIIEKKKIRSSSLKKTQKFSRNYKKTFTQSPKKVIKDSKFLGKDFERRKLAEQKAKKRIRGGIQEEKANKGKSNIIKKREYKLTLSRALNDDDVGFKSRSLASIKKSKKKRKPTDI